MFQLHALTTHLQPRKSPKLLGPLGVSGATNLWILNSFSSHPALHAQMATCSASPGASCPPQAPCWCPHGCRRSWC